MNGYIDRYELRLYDTPLLSFELSSDTAIGYSAKINSIGEQRSLLPLDLEFTGEGILKWLERRVIPKNRTFVEEILRVFDALTYNEDRHFGNFGLLRDNHTGKIIAPAPIFDNGVSLFNYAMSNDFINLDDYAKTRFPVYGGTTFEGICQSFMTSRQTEKLRKILTFKFTRHPKLNLPEGHLSAIEKHLRKRASQLINLAK